ncbi:MAG: sulfurtransferase [Thiobacillus sp.]|nr:sulfurtransferase [Thiobacillus sp.]
MYYTTLVSTDDLARHLGDPNWVVVDCRFTLTDSEAGRQAYLKGHIPGARYAHLDEDLSAPIGPTTGRHPLPGVKALTEKLCKWGIGVNKQVVVYDDSFGAMAVRLWWLLRWLGHPGVALLDGGYPKWVREHRPVTHEVCQVECKGACASLPEPSMCVNADEVMTAMQTGDKLILDARPDRRFTGEFEPLDPVAGHVPGAVNWMFDENLDLDGTFMPPEALRENYQALLKGRAPSEVIHMCGSGVTACHNILAMEVAGLSGSRLYVGSWSEWITDPTRPVATGE